MADERKTELMNDESRTTSVMSDNNISSRQTELMGNNRSDRVTSIMEVDSAIDFSRRTSIDRYKIKKVIAENTGEASLLLTENEGKSQVIKLYHINTKPDERIE